MASAEVMEVKAEAGKYTKHEDEPVAGNVNPPLHPSQEGNLVVSARNVAPLLGGEGVQGECMARSICLVNRR